MPIESRDPEQERIDIQHYWNDWVLVANQTKRALKDDPYVWAMHNKLELLGFCLAHILGLEGPTAIFNKDFTEIEKRSLEEFNYDEDLYNKYENVRLETNKILQKFKELKSKYPTRVVPFTTNQGSELSPQTILDISESEMANVMASFEKLRTLLNKIGNLLYGKDVGFL